ncbi:hypothetical protein Pla110_43150 [Polystyrenella longa]|uniref:Uncharacterized protein n=1 Tax=Polystyrenella longa TaxID=2528007 RepID=A0A518CTJ7_9PLAN|nr:hypothetical protein Pla110_43150 [Polystyrenella longa]
MDFVSVYYWPFVLANSRYYGGRHLHAYSLDLLLR